MSTIEKGREEVSLTSELANQLIFWAKSRKRTSLTLPGGYKISPQNPNTDSIWAKWVREGRLKATDVYWLYHGRKPQRVYLAVHLDTGHGKGTMIDLTQKDGKDRINALIAAFKAYRPKDAPPLPVKVSTPKDDLPPMGGCPTCGRTLDLYLDGKARCPGCQG